MLVAAPPAIYVILIVCSLYVSLSPLQLVFLYIPILALYLIGYRESDGEIQTLLTFGIAFGTFICTIQAFSISYL